MSSQFNEMDTQTPERFAEVRLNVADIALRVIGVMLLGALGVGFMGLAGTLALSTRERRNELVMLRAVGAKQRQVRLLVWIEATFIGVVAVLVGMSVGSGARVLRDLRRARVADGPAGRGLGPAGRRGRHGRGGGVAGLARRRPPSLPGATVRRRSRRVTWIRRRCRDQLAAGRAGLRTLTVREFETTPRNLTRGT